ncbi:YPO3983 family protein [Trabulsiella odontotermitis]|uniref:DUF3289 family protein n=1 Tax=Trabulsiella odontotermitis TaxID=379893 RepID=A0A0L0GJR1_9ENTR|nr:YPO3983 family protein [Trabulsiella odontotermitis]KNC89041.1 hypothetical protein GM31_08205 [Trabulsiella odontotermitis]
MNNDLALFMSLPATVFRTIKRFDDSSSDDMKCGDLDERQLISLGLDNISTKVDPYRLIRYDIPLSNNVNRLYGEMYPPRVKGRKISRLECVNILFDELKECSSMFTLLGWGKYSHLIIEMIDHFRYGNGSPFYSLSLNNAYEERINEYDEKAPLRIIKSAINKVIAQQTANAIGIKLPLVQQIELDLHDSRLSKFNQQKDKFNGLGITVHDVHAQQIDLIRLTTYALGWEAWLHFRAQDHFGLDTTDISSSLYNKFAFFRIWFFLQRHRDFAFKPFFTNFSSTVMLSDY